MRFKGTFVLALVFAALGGYVYLTEFRGKEEREKEEAAKKRLFAGEAKDISEITLEYGGRNITGARKGEKNWEIASPPGIEADSEAWEQLASNFFQIEKDEVVSAQKTDLAPYGLDTPAIAVTAKLKGGTSSGVFFGSENPKKTFNYAKRTDNDEVFLASTSWSGLFKKSLTDLRNKKVLDFETDSIDSLRIAAAGKPEIEIQKSGMEWLIKKPVETRADGSEVSSFLSSIEFARTAAFAEDLNQAATGVDSPPVRITLHDKKANADLVLLFGKSSEKDKYYAKDQSRTPIFILGNEVFQKTQRPLLDWRDRSVVRFGEGGTSLIDEIEIARGSDKIVFKKTGMDWQTTDGQKIQQSKVSDLLGALESERALQIVDSPGPPAASGLDKPKLTVALRQTGKEVELVKFGRDSANPAGLFVKASGSATMVVAKTLFETFDIKLSDFLETKPGFGAPSK